MFVIVQVSFQENKNWKSCLENLEKAKGAFSHNAANITIRMGINVERERSPLDLIWWLTFQIPDQWNSISLADFSGTRPMEFHRSGWFFKCQIDGIPLIWSLKFQNTLRLSTLSMNWAELHFWPLGHLSNGFQEKETEIITFQKFFSLLKNWHFLENYPKNVIWKTHAVEKNYIKETGEGEYHTPNEMSTKRQNLLLQSHYCFDEIL